MTWHAACAEQCRQANVKNQSLYFITITEKKKAFRSIIHPWWVTVLISFPHVCPQTTPTPAPLHPIHIYPQCRVGYLTNVRQSISDQQEPKIKGIKKNKKTPAVFFSLVSSLAQSRPFFFFFLL